MQGIQHSPKQKLSRHPRHVLHRLSRGTADLIDILMSTILIAGILTAVFAAAGTYKQIRRTSLDRTATKIASTDIENVRKLIFTDVSVGTTQLSAAEYPDLSKLPTSVPATRTVAYYVPPSCNLACGNQDAKNVSVVVNWTEKGLARQITLETIIYKYGVIKK